MGDEIAAWRALTARQRMNDLMAPKANRLTEEYRTQMNADKRNQDKTAKEDN